MKNDEHVDSLGLGHLKLVIINITDYMKVKRVIAQIINVE